MAKNAKLLHERNVAHFAEAETEHSESQPFRLRIFTSGTLMLH